jgi:hypothetical protein
MSITKNMFLITIALTRRTDERLHRPRRDAHTLKPNPCFAIFYKDITSSRFIIGVPFVEFCCDYCFRGIPLFPDFYTTQQQV